MPSDSKSSCPTVDGQVKGREIVKYSGFLESESSTCQHLGGESARGFLHSRPMNCVRNKTAEAGYISRKLERFPNLRRGILGRDQVLRHAKHLALRYQRRDA